MPIILIIGPRATYYSRLFPTLNVLRGMMGNVTMQQPYKNVKNWGGGFECACFPFFDNSERRGDRR